MRPEIEKLKSHIDANSISSGGFYHKSRDEVKLQFYTKCVNHAQKCRLVELTRAENDFRRKYSWHLDNGQNTNLLMRRSLPVARELSENKCLRKYSNPRRVAFTETQESEPDGGTVNPTGPSNSRIQSQPDTGMTMSCPQSSRPAIGLSNRRHSSFHGPILTSRGSSTLATMRRPVRNTMSCPSTGRKPSAISLYSNDRLSQLENLWDRVFKSDDIEQDSYCGQKARKQDRTARERFSAIVLQQFKTDAVNEKTDTPRRPLKGKGRNLDAPWHSTPRTYTQRRSTLHEPDIRISERCNEDGRQNERILNGLNCVRKKHLKSVSEGECHSRRGSEAGGTYRTDKCMDVDEGKEEGKRVDRSENTEILPEPKTLHINVDFSDSSLESPDDNSIHSKAPSSATSSRSGSSFGAGREKYRSLYTVWIKGLWQVCFLGILATRSGRPRFRRYVNLYVQREKTDVLKNKLWEMDMRRCNYLRIRKLRDGT